MNLYRRKDFVKNFQSVSENTFHRPYVTLCRMQDPARHNGLR